MYPNERCNAGQKLAFVQNDEFLIADKRPIAGDLKFSDRGRKISRGYPLNRPRAAAPWTIVVIVVIVRFHDSLIITVTSARATAWAE
jgi:hypothetical protein